jgi:hypothetical protein
MPCSKDELKEWIEYRQMRISRQDNDNSSNNNKDGEGGGG